ncbi:aldehyde dehydrogenase family protein [Amycolatopsis halotolerans]|uniref:aldehyde dehydrogenase family protein n=1 Tax=Amycolatopsis halotolerans TaxID=330083 RepID=UPI0036729031
MTPLPTMKRTGSAWHAPNPTTTTSSLASRRRWTPPPPTSPTSSATRRCSTKANPGPERLRDHGTARENHEWDANALLRGAFDLMMEHREDLAVLISLENDKALVGARAEVSYAAEFFRWYSGGSRPAGGHDAACPGGGHHIVTVLKPVGVTALVTLWNFPATMATRKVGPALATGCTTVLKPSAETPLTALALAALLDRAGVVRAEKCIRAGQELSVDGRSWSGMVASRAGALRLSRRGPSVRCVAAAVDGRSREGRRDPGPTPSTGHLAATARWPASAASARGPGCSSRCCWWRCRARCCVGSGLWSARTRCCGGIEPPGGSR